MKGYLRLFLNAILSGLAIGIAGTVFLRVREPLVGSWLFGFGLLCIVVFGFKLFTGAIGYLAIQGRNAPRYALDCLIIWLGNLAGTCLVGTAVRATRVFPSIDARVTGMVAEKLSDGPISIFLLAFFCGLLMYIAVDTFRHSEIAAPIRLIVLFLCVVVFILSGFEHCIANMYYFSVSAAWGAHTFAWLGIMTAGNACGGMLIPVADCYRHPPQTAHST